PVELPVGRREALLVDLQALRRDELTPVVQRDGVRTLRFELLKCHDTFPWSRALLRIELNDQFLVDRHGQIGSRRQSLDAARESLGAHLEPLRNASPLRKLERLTDAGDLAAPLAHRDRVPGPHQVRRHIDLPAVDAEVAVPHELPRLGARGREAEPIDDVVEPPLEQLEQGLARHAPPPVRHREVPPELPFEHTVDASQLLLLTELHRVLGELRSGLAVLARRVVPSLDGALVGVAPFAVQEELQSMTPAVPVKHYSVTLKPLTTHQRLSID